MNTTRKTFGAIALLVAIVFSTSNLFAETQADLVGHDLFISSDCSASPISDYVDKYHVRLEKTVPSVVTLNEDYSYDYIVIPKDKLKRVVIEEQIPSGTTYVSSSPTAQIEGSTVTWTLYNLEEGEIVPLELVVNASTVTDFTNCATIVAYPEACTTTAVGVPALSVKKTTPEESVMINTEVPWNIKVTNTGNFCCLLYTSPSPRDA